MILETKYDLGQLVHVLSHGQVKRVVEECPTCLGTGHIDVRGEAFICPKCKGTKTVTEAAHAWFIQESSTIGRVEVRTRDRDEIDTDDPRTTAARYMIHATGVGSGSVWEEHKLWGGTREEAQAEVNRRNEAGEWP